MKIAFEISFSFGGGGGELGYGREGDAYRDEEAIGARTVEVESVEEIGGEVGDGAVVRFE